MNIWCIITIFELLSNTVYTHIRVLIIWGLYSFKEPHRLNSLISVIRLDFLSLIYETWSWTRENCNRLRISSNLVVREEGLSLIVIIGISWSSVTILNIVSWKSSFRLNHHRTNEAERTHNLRTITFKRLIFIENLDFLLKLCFWKSLLSHELLPRIIQVQDILEMILNLRSLVLEWSIIYILLGL